MNTSRMIRAQTDVMARMLGYEPPYEPPDVWLEIVGIPLDEWMAIRTPLQFRMARARRALREIKGRLSHG